MGFVGAVRLWKYHSAYPYYNKTGFQGKLIDVRDKIFMLIIRLLLLHA